MQIKKFEAPTIQEALETIKRELGPEAIILQTKQNKRGFGLMSKASVEVTAAVSERSIQKKNLAEKSVPPASREALKKLPAEKQAEFYDKMMDKHLERATQQTQDRVELGARKSPGARAGAGAAAGGASRGATGARTSQNTVHPATRVYHPQERSAPPAAPAGRGGSAKQQASAGASRPAMSQTTSARRYIDIDDEEPTSQVTESAAPPAGPARFSPAPGMSLEEEVRHLKRMLEELKINQEKDETGTLGSGLQAMVGNQAGASALGSPALQDAFEQLVLNGLDKRYAYTIAKQAGFELGPEASGHPDAVLDQLAVEIMKSTEVRSAFESIGSKPAGDPPAVVALVGPTGVGKTTTVAKLASDALLRRNLKVGLINLDSYKVAAFDQLGTYAKILNVPFRSVASVDDLKIAIQDFQHLDLVLIDTTGRSQRDPSSLKEMQTLLSAIPNIRMQLVLSVTTRDTELYDMANRFQMFKPDGIIVSKLDEATAYGAIYNVSQKTKLPLLYFTTGQRVPEDIEEATCERVAALILDI